MYNTPQVKMHYATAVATTVVLCVAMASVAYYLASFNNAGCM